MTKTSEFKTWIRSVVIVSVLIIFLATLMGSKSNQARVQSGALEKVKLVTATGPENDTPNVLSN